jgi:hypothetical protein
MDVVDSFLHRSFVVGQGIEKLKASVPRKPKRERQLVARESGWIRMRSWRAQEV